MGLPCRRTQCCHVHAVRRPHLVDCWLSFVGRVPEEVRHKTVVQLPDSRALIVGPSSKNRRPARYGGGKAPTCRHDCRGGRTPEQCLQGLKRPVREGTGYAPTLRSRLGDVWRMYAGRWRSLSSTRPKTCTSMACLDQSPLQRTDPAVSISRARHVAAGIKDESVWRWHDRCVRQPWASRNVNDAHCVHGTQSRTSLGAVYLGVRESRRGARTQRGNAYAVCVSTQDRRVDIERVHLLRAAQQKRMTAGMAAHYFCRAKSRFGGLGARHVKGSSKPKKALVVEAIKNGTSSIVSGYRRLPCPMGKAVQSPIRFSGPWDPRLVGVDTVTRRSGGTPGWWQGSSLARWSLVSVRSIENKKRRKRICPVARRFDPSKFHPVRSTGERDITDVPMPGGKGVHWPVGVVCQSSRQRTRLFGCVVVQRQGVSVAR